jgi:hypothetical protein
LFEISECRLGGGVLSGARKGVPGIDVRSSCQKSVREIEGLAG